MILNRSLLFMALFSACESAWAAPCRNPSLGAELTNISNSIRQTRQIPEFVDGALVRVVLPKTPAARAGLEAGDVIQAVGSDLVQNVCDVRAVIARRGCAEVRLRVRRADETIVVDVRPVDESRLPGKKLDDARACLHGDGAACTAQAKKHGNAAELLQVACDLGDSEGCYLLAFKATDHKRALAAYAQACDGGNALACTNLGYMYELGQGVAADPESAVRLYSRGCAGSICTGTNNLGCVNLGRAYRDGLGVQVDPYKAIGLFRGVCERKVPPVDDQDAGHMARACSLAGTAMLFGEGVVRDVPAALAFLERGCAVNDTFGCYNLGTIYESGDHVSKDKSRAATYYQRACDAGDTEACERVAIVRK